MTSLQESDLQRLSHAAHEYVEAVADLTQRICSVPSPTGEEGDRATFLAELWRQRGYEPKIDGINNVSIRRGHTKGPAVMLLAHIDTVFPASVPIKTHREGNWLYGPGIGDNSLGVASMIGLIDLLDQLQITTEVDLIVVGNVGEEGLGNLRGARQAVTDHLDHLGAVLVLDGEIGYIVHKGVGSRRWRVTVKGPGGHSFGDFGYPSAIHGLARIVTAIADLKVPEYPRTTYNVGLIEGGTSVNTIAPEASAVIDMRSVDPTMLHNLSEQIRALVYKHLEEGLHAEIEVLGERPAGEIARSHPLVQLAVDALSWVGRSAYFEAASTDANIPLSLGIPAVCTGFSQGQGAHTVQEKISLEPLGDGLAQVLRLCVETCEWVANNTK